jgi:folate-binding Fe-S cluster repair protein YgfZ
MSAEVHFHIEVYRIHNNFWTLTLRWLNTIFWKKMENFRLRSVFL